MDNGTRHPSTSRGFRCVNDASTRTITPTPVTADGALLSALNGVNTRFSSPTWAEGPSCARLLIGATTMETMNLAIADGRQRRNRAPTKRTPRRVSQEWFSVIAVIAKFARRARRRADGKHVERRGSPLRNDHCDASVAPVGCARTGCARRLSVSTGLLRCRYGHSRLPPEGSEFRFQ